MRSFIVNLVKQLAERSDAVDKRVTAGTAQGTATHTPAGGEQGDGNRAAKGSVVTLHEGASLLSLPQTRPPSGGVGGMSITVEDGGRPRGVPARGETPLLMLDRWQELHDELYNEDTGFDITKARYFGPPVQLPPPPIPLPERLHTFPGTFHGYLRSQSRVRRLQCNLYGPCCYTMHN